MFARKSRIESVLSLAFIVVMGACGNFGGCGACGSSKPLPGGRLPTDQTIEGGAQIRVTETGFKKLTGIIPPLMNQAFANGFCAGKQSFGFRDPLFNTFTGLEVCNKNSGTTCPVGCKVNVGLNAGTTTFAVTATNKLRMNLSLTANTAIKLQGFIAGGSLGTCNLNVSSTNFGGNFDVAFGVKPTNGELDIHLDRINSFQLNMDFSGCGFASTVAEFFTDVLDSFVGQFVIQLLSPAIDDLLQRLIPSPLGIASMMDIGALMSGISPGTNGFIEARIVPGGYVSLVNKGMSLGVITGLNADEDPLTRTPALDNEPHLCVPPLAGPTYTLPTVARSGLGGSTFSMAPAAAFSGGSDPQADIAMGVSETTLDLAGHHLVTSGGMCLGVGTSLIAQLNIGTVGILVPSLADLGSDTGNDPLLLVTRPQKAIDFTIGDGTTTSPHLTIHLKNLEVDFYGFLFERYTRAFTMDLTMNIGINLAFDQPATGPAVIKPELVGISSSQVTVQVLNKQFVRESEQQLEMVLPSVFDLVTPLLGNLPDIPIPSFAGFTLSSPSIAKVTTTQDEFLALYATMNPGPMMRLAGGDDPFSADTKDRLDANMAFAQRSTGTARLMHVDTPEPSVIRDELISGNGALPSVAFEVDRYDPNGRELEWSWNLDGGLWRPFATATPLVISDRAFAWQGRYEIGLRSRVKGDFRTTSEVMREKIVIDSVGPRIFETKGTWDGDAFSVPVWDVVYGKDVEVAFGELGHDDAKTAWMPAREASITRAKAALLADGHDGELLMFARDDSGNHTVAVVAPFHGQAGSSGCSCETTGSPGAGGLVVFGLVGVSLLRRRRRGVWMSHAKQLATSRTARSLGMFIGVVLVSSLVPACSCGNNAGQACETAADCGEDFCAEHELPFCIDNMCFCSDDIPAGRIGPYSDVATGGGSTWVSAYASTHGDLVVAQAQGGRVPNESWEWVDGVPDGPIIAPDSKIRYGISESGPDVGMYTSIVVANDGTPMVSYFDRETASLKFATKAGGTWTTHVVQGGTAQIDPGNGGALIGMYTSMTLRSDDGKPGIAYLAHVVDSSSERAEVRYAQATTASPAGPGDWQTFVLDMAPLPDNPDEIYPLPGGLGLFVDSARDPRNGAPVVVYYDRANGDLKIARFNPMTSTWGAARVLDGSGTDAGWSPTVTVDTNGVAHIAYVSATGDDLKYTTDATSAPKEIVDDGYRIVGISVDGLPKPEFHFVGDDATILVPAGGQPMVTYQDATTHELLLAQRGTDGKWVRSSVAGNTDPWPGAYGFFASSVLSGTDLVMSTWVIHQPDNDNWVEVISRPIGIL